MSEYFVGDDMGLLIGDDVGIIVGDDNLFGTLWNKGLGMQCFL